MAQNFDATGQLARETPPGATNRIHWGEGIVVRSQLELVLVFAARRVTSAMSVAAEHSAGRTADARVVMVVVEQIVVDEVPEDEQMQKYNSLLSLLVLVVVEVVVDVAEREERIQIRRERERKAILHLLEILEVDVVAKAER